MQEIASPTSDIKKRKPHIQDLLWKGVIEDVLRDFLTFMDPDAETTFDLDKGIHFLDKELDQVFPPEGEEYVPKVIDKLIKVYKRNGPEEWILIHIEVQTKYKQNFGHRMFTYFYRIFDKYQKPISAYAIFTETTRKQRQNNFEISHAGTKLNYSFNTYKIADQDENALLASNNPFALIVLTAKRAKAGEMIKKEKRDSFFMNLKISLAKELLSRNIPKEKTRILMDFLKYYVRFIDPNNNIIFEKQLETLTGKNITMGIEELLLDMAKKEGEEIGIRKAEAKALEEKKVAAIDLKNLGLPLSDIVKTLRLSTQQVEALTRTT